MKTKRKITFKPEFASKRKMGCWAKPENSG